MHGSANFFGINFYKPIKFGNQSILGFYPFQMIIPPTSLEELKRRAESIAGKTMGELAVIHGAAIPDNLRVQKGWQGQFLELCLGADAGNQARPDFSLLDIELKTLPIDLKGKVQESTYVCVVNLSNNLGAKWRESVVFHKLKHVLWVPIAHRSGRPINESIIGTPFLWQMNSQQERLLKQDWDNAMDLISLGKVHQLNAKSGEILQVRPKAANSRVLTKVIDEQGAQSQTLPRGFYLRACFTQKLLEEHLRI